MASHTLLCGVFIQLALAFVVTALETPSLNVTVRERHTDGIKVVWTVKDADKTIDFYRISVEKSPDTDTYKAIYAGNEVIQPNNHEHEATVHVHESSTDYKVCVEAVYTAQAQQELSSPNRTGSSLIECVNTSTIGPLLTSSWVALLCVILFFLICILVGFITWKCAQRRYKTEPDYEKTEMNGNGDIVPLTQIED